MRSTGVVKRHVHLIESILQKNIETGVVPQDERGARLSRIHTVAAAMGAAELAAAGPRIVLNLRVGP